MHSDSSNMFHILNLPTLFNDVTDKKCISVVDTYFGNNNIFIYTVNGDKILERWLITPDGQQTNRTFVTETKYVCSSLVTIIIAMFSQFNRLMLKQKKLRY